jgi:CRISPR-associated exonuclease Cas4
VSHWNRADDPTAERLLVPVAAIEHYAYCPRQCALMYIEHIYRDNVYTVRGSLLHERVDEPQDIIEEGIPIYRALPLFSDELALIGRADLVEMHEGVPYPVEYKSGRRHGIEADLQLCAQALCLEEMFEQPVVDGAIYYFGSRRRHSVAIDRVLRQQVLSLIPQVRQLLKQDRTPPPVNDRRCRKCSLARLCLPQVVQQQNRLRGLQGALYRIDDTAD